MSDATHVSQNLKKYWAIGAVLFVFTVITVALIIAITKGSMVASIFMHLSHEKKWIYGALLLTVVFFTVLMFLPLWTVSDTIGTPTHAPAAATEAAH